MTSASNDASTGRQRSFLGSIKTLLSTLVLIVHTRIDMLASELEEEKIHLGRMLFLGVLTICFTFLALVFLSILVVVVFWDNHRFTALVGVVVFYLMVALISAISLRYQIRNKPRAFALTLAELRKDNAGLRGD